MFGENLKNLRIAAGLSQMQLAEMLRISHKTVSHWESGYSEPSISQIKQLKVILKTDYEDLLD